MNSKTKEYIVMPQNLRSCTSWWQKGSAELTLLKILHTEKKYYTKWRQTKLANERTYFIQELFFIRLTKLATERTYFIQELFFVRQTKLATKKTYFIQELFLVGQTNLLPRELFHSGTPLRKVDKTCYQENLFHSGTLLCEGGYFIITKQKFNAVSLDRLASFIFCL